MRIRIFDTAFRHLSFAAFPDHVARIGVEAVEIAAGAEFLRVALAGRAAA
jgi:hypothetical protein